VRRSRIAASTTTSSDGAIVQNQTYPVARNTQPHAEVVADCTRWPKHLPSTQLTAGSHLLVHAPPPQAPPPALGAPDLAARASDPIPRRRLQGCHHGHRPLPLSGGIRSSLRGTGSTHPSLESGPGRATTAAMDEEEGENKGGRRAPCRRQEPARALAGASRGSPLEPHARARACPADLLQCTPPSPPSARESLAAAILASRVALLAACSGGGAVGEGGEKSGGG
jgi:hypothetical protein